MKQQIEKAMQRQHINKNKMFAPPIFQFDRRQEILSDHKNCRHRASEKFEHKNCGVGEQAANYCCTNDFHSILSNNKQIFEFLHSTTEPSHTDRTIQYADESAKDNSLQLSNSKNVYGRLRKTTSLDNTLTNCKEENIYENVCDTRCDPAKSDSVCQFFDLAPKITNEKRGIFRFLGNIKRKTSLPSRKEPVKRLEIIHNVTEAFKTQESFDLQEICQMRDEGNILRKTNNNNSHNCTALSDTYRKFHVYEDENIYENLDFMKSSLNSVSGFEIPVNNQDWRKRLRHETHDYNENDFFYLKSIPSHHQKFVFDENIVFLRNDKQTNGHDVSHSNVLKLSTSLSLEDNKRRCYYLQDQQPFDGAWKPTGISIILHNTSNQRENENSDFVEGLLKLFDAYLTKSHMSEHFECVAQSHEETSHEETSHEVTTNANIEVHPIENVTVSVAQPLLDIVAKQLITYPQRKTKITNKKYLSIHHLSVGLNTLTNIYWPNDKKIQHFISKFLTPSTNCYQIDFQRVIQQSNNMRLTTNTAALTLSGTTAPKSKKTLTDFLKQPPSCDFTVKTTIYDFIAQKNTVIKTQSDEPNDRQELKKYDKKFIDFIVRPIENDKDWQYFLRTSETIDLDATKKMENFVAKPNQALEVNCCENIYQPIWDCQTDGAGMDMNENNEENVYEMIKIGSRNSSDLDKWELADEFAFGHSLSESSSKTHLENSNSKNLENLYTRVCILFDANNSSLNRFIYESMDSHMVYQDEQESFVSEMADESIRQKVSQHPKEPLIIGWPSTYSANLLNDWKYLLKTSLFCEDEEDVVINDSMMKKTQSTSAITFLYERQNKLTSAPNQIPLYKADSNDSSPSKTASPKPIKDYTLASNKSTVDKHSEIVGTDNVNGIYKRCDTDLQSDESLDTETKGIKRERKRDKFKAKLKLKAKDEDSGKLTSAQIDVENEIGILFGVDLEKVEKHSKYVDVPKFVVDCITILSECDKICTPGLYRASGNKMVIEKLKKQLNSPKQPRKSAPDYQFKKLQENDVHTLTGLLKHFFRELKSPLIPTEIFDDCTKESNLSLQETAQSINSIQEPSRSTLAFLLQHLKHVHKHSGENMMNSNNLSIIWGACLFASKVSEMNTVDNIDIKRINNFVCDLIDNSDRIFQNVNQKNQSVG